MYEENENERIEREEREAAGNAVKDMFSKPDLMDKKHMQEIGAELAKAGSKEKTGFIEKEAKYINKLEELQKEHLTTCIRLMTLGIVAYTI